MLDLEGTIYLSLDGNFDKVFPYLPRFGLGLKLPNDKTNATYYGYGPYESYSDKHRASWVDRFDTTVDDMFEDYVFPQENGSHYNCQYASVGNLFAKGKKPFSFLYGADTLAKLGIKVIPANEINLTPYLLKK